MDAKVYVKTPTGFTRLPYGGRIRTGDYILESEDNGL